MRTFRALWIDKEQDGTFRRSIRERSVDELPAGEVLVDVRYSSLNYKDALSATGNPGVTRKFPHTPGIDAAGVVAESESDAFAPGDEVIVIGFDLGMNTPGGFGQRIRVPADWAVRRPDGLSLEESMVLGTAGFTAAECVDKLERMGLAPGDGEVLVTGATGGVGSVAVTLLGQLGYAVAAGTGKASQADWLHELGAARIVDRESLEAGGDRPLLAQQWAGVVDTVGGGILFNAIKSLRYGASAACCGLVASPELPATVLPFILRHVNLLGVDSVELPIGEKRRIWQRLAGEWKPSKLSALQRTIGLEELPAAIDTILAGEMVGRCVVDLRG